MQHAPGPSNPTMQWEYSENIQLMLQLCMNQFVSFVLILLSWRTWNATRTHPCIYPFFCYNQVFDDTHTSTFFGNSSSYTNFHYFKCLARPVTDRYSRKMHLQMFIFCLSLCCREAVGKMQLENKIENTELDFWNTNFIISNVMCTWFAF